MNILDRCSALQIRRVVPSALMLALLVIFRSFGLRAARGDTSPGGTLKLTPAMLNFTYSTSSGDISLDCKATLADAQSQDWDVTCGDLAQGPSKKYTVHLWVTIYNRDVLPKQSYEVLYWVTDNSLPGTSHGASATVWFNFKEPSDLTQLQLSLGVEDDTAELQLTINP